MTAKVKQAGGKDQGAGGTVVEKLKPEQELQLRRHARSLMEPGKGILAGIVSRYHYHRNHHHHQHHHHVSLSLLDIRVSPTR